MKAIVSIMLSALVLLQGLNVQMKDVLEVDALFRHLEYHLSSEGDDFYSFLEKHYGSQKFDHEHKGQSDDQNHEKLPFKDKAHQNSNNVVMVLTSNTSRDLVASTISSRSNFYHEDNYSYLQQKDFFQPPRIS